MVGSLCDADRSRLVVDVDQVGERAADVDTESASLRPPPGSENDLSEELPALHRAPSPARASSSGNVADDPRLEARRGRSGEARLDLAPVEDERADDLQLRGGRTG